MEHKAFKEAIVAARQAFSAGKVPSEGDFGGLISVVENAGFSRGMIMMFSGTKDDKPDGWAWCDGTTEGVPDLTGRFIVGDTILAAHSRQGNEHGMPFNFNAGTFAVTPGTFNATISGATDNTELTVDQLPAHDHREAINWTPYSYKKGKYDSLDEYRGGIIGENRYSEMTVDHHQSLAYLGIVPYNPASLLEGGMWSQSYKMHTATTGAAHASHGHGISGKFDVTFTSPHALTVSPPYYALAFIMKL